MTKLPCGIQWTPLWSCTERYSGLLVLIPTEVLYDQNRHSSRQTPLLEAGELSCCSWPDFARPLPRTVGGVTHVAVSLGSSTGDGNLVEAAGRDLQWKEWAGMGQRGRTLVNVMHTLSYPPLWGPLAPFLSSAVHQQNG